MSRKFDIEQSVGLADVFEVRWFLRGMERSWDGGKLKMVLRHPVLEDIVVESTVEGYRRLLTLPEELGLKQSPHSREMVPWRYEIVATYDWVQRVLVSGTLVPVPLAIQPSGKEADRKRYIVEVHTNKLAPVGVKNWVPDMSAWRVRVAEDPGKHACDNVTSSVASGSTALITSGGVYTGLSGKQNKLVYDAKPVKNSGNAVTSGAIYTAIEKVKAVAKCNMPELWVGVTHNRGGYAMALGRESCVKTGYSTAVGWSALSERRGEMKIVAAAEEASYPHGLELVLHVTGYMPEEPDGDGFYAAGMGNLEFCVFEREWGAEGSLRKREKVTISAKAFMQMLIAAGGVKTVE